MEAELPQIHITLTPTGGSHSSSSVMCHLTRDDHPLVIKKVYHKDRTFNLVQDTDLPAGTKQRGLSFFLSLKQAGFDELVTYGTVHGYGQVATAWCCRTAGLICTIFLPRTHPRTCMTKLAIRLGAIIIDVDPDNGYPTTSVLAIKARTYALKNVKCRLLDIGLDDPDFIKHLGEGIAKVSSHIKPTRIWVAGGSGVLARALSRAFPESEICIVQVGRKIYPDVLSNMNYKLYISPEPFRRAAEFPPPYKSLRHYDAKVWRFVRKYGEEGDYIWNVK
ncbi:Hypothetical protein HVR_LOCUS640 [uncultured virus]|nr:Hypothetical protein HVR_LOCUS640 [uncultured virus]